MYIYIYIFVIFRPASSQLDNHFIDCFFCFCLACSQQVGPASHNTTSYTNIHPYPQFCPLKLTCLCLWLWRQVRREKTISGTQSLWLHGVSSDRRHLNFLTTLLCGTSLKCRCYCSYYHIFIMMIVRIHGFYPVTGARIRVLLYFTFFNRYPVTCHQLYIAIVDHQPVTIDKVCLCVHVNLGTGGLLDDPMENIT